MASDETLPAGEQLEIATHRGDESTPWQFSVTRTASEIVITQARGKPEQFDPVIKRFTIEDRSVGEIPVEFHHAIIRRVWTEDPDRPQIKSSRSEGRQVEFLYQDDDGWHLAQPEAESGQSSFTEPSAYEPTKLPGVTASSTFLRASQDGETKYAEERDYRVTSEILDEFSEVYVLSYHEVNEESVEDVLWEVANAFAYRLIPKNRS